MDLADRVLPHDLDAERAVLGAILLHPERFADVAGLLAGGDFFRDAHRRIFESLAALDAAGVPADLLTLRADLARRGDLDEVGGPAYLAALADGLPHASNLPHYAALVRERRLLRDLAAAGARLSERAYAATEPAAALIDAAVRHLSGLAATGRRGAVTADAAVGAYLAGLDTDAGLAVPSGLADLDALTGGFRPRELTIIAARPSVGKSSVALGAAYHLARAGHGTAYFSPEMSLEALAARLLGWESGVPAATVERKAATAAQWAEVSRAMTAFADVPLYLDDGSRTVGEVVAWCRRLQQQRGLAAVFVDYLQLLLPDRPGRSRQEEVALISASLKQLAKDLGVAVIALSQLGRAPDDRRDKRPHLADLRESGALEQDADLAILLFREEMHRPTEANAGIAEAIIAKQRNGPTGVVRLCFVKELAQFRNLAPEYGA